MSKRFVVCLCLAFSSYGIQAGAHPQCDLRLSKDLVTVYRGVIVERIEDLDFDYNYSSDKKTTYGSDFFSTDFRVAATYLKGSEDSPNAMASMLVYRIPRALLEDRGNDMYAVSAAKLNSLGLSSTRVFLERVAMVKSELPPQETLSAQDRKIVDEAARASSHGFIKRQINGFDLVFRTGESSSLLNWIPNDVIAAIKNKAQDASNTLVNKTENNRAQEN